MTQQLHSSQRITAPNSREIYAYIDSTPGGRYRYILYNPFKAKPRESQGRTCGTWTKHGSPEHKAATVNIERLLKKRSQQFRGVADDHIEQEVSDIGFLEFLSQRANLCKGKNKGRPVAAIAYCKEVFPASLKLKELRYKHWVQLEELLLARVSAETARNYTAWIKGQLNKAARMYELIERSPWAGLNISVGNYHHAPHKKQRLTPAELEQLKQARTTKPYILRTFLFACATGTGHADIFGSDTNPPLKHGNIKRNADGSGRLTYTRAKTRSTKPMTASLPLSAKTMRFIGPERPANEPLFPKLPSEPTINKELQRMAASVGLNRPDLTFYCGRHSFICLHIEKGTPLTVLQRMTGHAELKALMRYAQSLELESDQYTLDF